MASGVKIHDGAKAVYNDIKQKKKHQYVIYKIDNNNTEIVIEETGEKGATYEEFVGKLLEVQKNRECRYAVFDCAYLTHDTKVEKNKLAFFSWSPDDATIKQKMLYASSKDALKKALSDNTKDLQCNDADDLSWTNVLEIISKMDRN